jgi:hypothetical protein
MHLVRKFCSVATDMWSWYLELYICRWFWNIILFMAQLKSPWGSHSRIQDYWHCFWGHNFVDSCDPYLRTGKNIFCVFFCMYVFSLIVQIIMCQYVSNINSYFSDGSTKYDGSCQLLLLVIQTLAGTPTKFFITVVARTIYASSHRAYTNNWNNSNNPPPYCQHLRFPC